MEAVLGPHPMAHPAVGRCHRDRWWTFPLGARRGVVRPLICTALTARATFPLIWWHGYVGHFNLRIPALVIRSVNGSIP